MNEEYKRHHYVPQWYQKKFMLPGETELWRLDMKPESVTDSRGKTYKKKGLERKGAKKCFVEDHLYTATIRSITTKDIERVFFGTIDNKGRAAVEYFENFTYPLKPWGTSFEDLMRYMSTQKLRTPKGLKQLSKELNTDSKIKILSSMIRLGGIHCALWTECVWLIADASNSETKFIVSDHPVTVYNRECGPRSPWCRDTNDPDISLQGTHTIFPLSLNKILILTNLSWVRNPYQQATKPRPNPNPYRGAMFKFTDIQILRFLTEQEVREINFIIKTRAYRYIAAAKEEWLFPEKFISKSNWHSFGNGYLLMPDPRAIHWGGEIIIGHNDGTASAYDEYGRRPWDPDYSKETKSGSEHDSLQWFQGEFAMLFGPYRRGRTFEAMRLDPERDDDEFHQYHLNLQKKRQKRFSKT